MSLVVLHEAARDVETQNCQESTADDYFVQVGGDVEVENAAAVVTAQMHVLCYVVYGGKQRVLAEYLFCGVAEVEGSEL